MLVLHKVAIVGGSGFIGSALASSISGKFEVEIVDKKRPINMITGVRFHECDIRNYEQAKHALENVDMVLHTAIVQIPQINDQRRLGYEVNILGTQNVCKAVDESKHIKGMILISSWHVMGERGIEGTVNEEFGFRPEKVEDRARLYAFSKIGQEVILRCYDAMSDKIYGVLRLGTVLGPRMPEKTAASIFIERGLRGDPITPYRHSMYRPMLYVDLEDVCRALEIFTFKIIKGDVIKKADCSAPVVNVFYPEPITIIELAKMIRETITVYTRGKVKPEIKILDIGHEPLLKEADKQRFRIDISQAESFLGLHNLKTPRESIKKIIKVKIAEYGLV